MINDCTRGGREVPINTGLHHGGGRRGIVVSVYDVAVEVALLRGPEVTVGALEGLLPRVGSDVATEEGRGHEVLAAVATHVVAVVSALHHAVWWWWWLWL